MPCFGDSQPRLKLYNRALDIMPDDPDLISAKASVYQAEGNLQEAARLLSQLSAQTPPLNALIVKTTQLRLERNHGEAIRLQRARLAQFQFAPEIDQATNRVILAFAQRLAGDTAGTKATAEQARNILMPLCKNQPDNSFFHNSSPLPMPCSEKRRRR